MLKSKDFILKNVEGITGKRIGFINDVLLNINNREIIGFSVISKKLFSKDVYILKENIISFGDKLIFNGFNKGKYLKLSNIKGFEVIDIEGNIIGILEDILVGEEGLTIKGILVSTGLIENFIEGKRILLLDDIILGDNSIFLFNSNKEFNFYTKPHFTTLGDEENKNHK
ncbi:PRC-barrel domain-containing protein [Clostridium sediminicola]|uniref:PRC-barrel domain-containing protein n=1 Tax=Clostridium sediminicola TaxID=3114879 RepID=UPI0031F20E65